MCGSECMHSRRAQCDDGPKPIPRFVSLVAALQVLDLGSNRIRAIQGLDSMLGLQELWLGRNRIAEISGLNMYASERSAMACVGRGCVRNWQATSNKFLLQHWMPIRRLQGLKRLSIQNNRLERLSGLEACTDLEELYLSHNGLQDLEASLWLRLVFWGGWCGSHQGVAIIQERQQNVFPCTCQEVAVFFG